MDGTTETERDAIEWITLLAATSETAAAVIALPGFQDSITGMERDALEWIRWLAKNSEEAGASVIALPWMQDGISETELDALKWLSWIAHESETAAAVIAMSWMQDDITGTERDALEWIRWIVHESTPAAAIVSMPFLHTLERDDVLAIRGISTLARAEDKELLDALLEHPTFRNGITDAQTTLLTAAATVREPEEVRRMLEPGYADIETVSSGTKLSPNLKISIVRTGTPAQPQTLEAIKNAVKFAEQTMQLPLPVSHVILVLNDWAFPENYGGTNFGFAFGYDPEREQKERGYDKYSFQSSILHEVAHYFWRGHADWIDEGVADTFEYMHGVEAGVSPGLLERPRRRNCEAHDLELLTEWSPEQEDIDQFRCNYFLGQMLFLELLEDLGEDRFNEKLRELYYLSLLKKKAKGEPGIKEVRLAFADQAEIVEKHWSGRLNAPENRPFDEAIYRRNHGLIQWHQYPTYDGDSVSFSGTLLGDAVLSKETIHEAKKGGYQNFALYHADKSGFVGSIFPALNDNRSWKLDDPGDTTAIEYQLEERTFTVKFRLRQRLSSPSHYVVIVRGFQDETRTSFIGENIDRLGYAQIRVE